MEPNPDADMKAYEKIIQEREQITGSVTKKDF